MTGSQGLREKDTGSGGQGFPRRSEEVINIFCTCFKYDMTCNIAVLVVYDRGIFTVLWNKVQYIGALHCFSTELNQWGEVGLWSKECGRERKGDEEQIAQERST